MEHESIEIETRYKLSTQVGGYLAKALGAELVSVIHGTDYYLGWKKSIETGEWRRLRFHRVQQNGTSTLYQVSQVKTRIQTPQSPYGIECWRESEPKPVDVLFELEKLKEQGLSPLVVEAIREYYRFRFDGEELEMNIDEVSRCGFFVEIEINVTDQKAIPKYTELVSYCIDKNFLPAFRRGRIDVKVAPTYQEILSNGVHLL